MPRVTHVKKAQQRYKTKPVIDPATGEQKVVPVLKADGSPKLTRSKPGRPGRPIVRRLTEDDKSQPLPNRKCGKCGTEIKVGDPYKWIAPKSGPYGGTKMYRCGPCPTWQVWEYSSSTSARVAQLQHEAESRLSEFDSMESGDDAESIRDEIAQEIRDFASEKEEAADNIEEGFGHETYQSQEIREVQEQLESWADEVEGVDFPEFPETSECSECEGSGERDCENSDFHNEDREIDEDETCPDCDGEVNTPGTVSCEECSGSGQVDEPDEDALNEWRDEARSALEDAIGNCPL